jgi:anti-anti-sigma factor
MTRAAPAAGARVADGHALDDRLPAVWTLVRLRGRGADARGDHRAVRLRRAVRRTCGARAGSRRRSAGPLGHPGLRLTAVLPGDRGQICDGPAVAPGAWTDTRAIRDLPENPPSSLPPAWPLVVAGLGRHARVTPLRRPARDDPATLRVTGTTIGRRALLSPHGPVDIATVDTLRHALSAVVHADEREVWIDLRGITFLSLEGVHLLLAAQDALGLDERRLAIICPAGPARRTIELAGSARTLPLFHSLSDARRGA